MFSISPYAPPTFPAATTAPLFDVWGNVANFYRDAMQASTQQLLQSSANIIQEHTLRALIAASKACSEALAKNAVAVQQQSLERLFDANQKAVGEMGQAFARVWMGSLQIAK